MSEESTEMILVTLERFRELQAIEGGILRFEAWLEDLYVATIKDHDLTEQEREKEAITLARIKAVLEYFKKGGEYVQGDENKS